MNGALHPTGGAPSACQARGRLDNQAMPHRASRPGGFSLIEVMITIAIAGILLGVALPVYQDSVRKSRRSDAVSALTQLQQGQERWRTNNPTYSGNLADLWDGGASTQGGYYGLAAAVDADPAVGARAYMLIATGAAGTTQADDERCYRLRLRVDRGNIWYGSACKTCGAVYDETPGNLCWSR